jgi:ABC-type uncharacterized transport system permease subunit
MGLTAGLGVVVWHAAARRVCPLNDNFAALVFLGVLLGLFVMYMQRFRPVAGLDWFVMPIVILLLVGAGVFGRLDYHRYGPMVHDTWMWVHRVTTYGGAAVFAVAAAGGMMYVAASRRLRRKMPPPVFGSLERLEGLLMHSVYLGFALLTVGVITGLVRMFGRDPHLPVAKLVLGSSAWLVYAVVLHSPINPRLRGRRVAMLSVLGFVLLVGTIVVVQLMPGGQH